MAARMRAAIFSTFFLRLWPLLCYTKQAMKFLRPMVQKAKDSGRSLFSRSSGAPVAAQAPTSFGEKRAQEMNRRMESARAERQKLIRAEYASQGTSAHDAISVRRQQADRTISRLQSEQQSND